MQVRGYAMKQYAASRWPFALIASVVFSLLLLVAMPMLSYAADEDYFEDCSHRWSAWEVTAKSTAYKTGMKERYCKVCYELQEKAIPKRKLSKAERQVKRLALIYLKAAKSYKWKKMNKCFAKKGKKYGYPTKPSIVKCYKKFNKRMLKWRILDITKKGSTYLVSVEVTRPNGWSLAYNPLYGQLVKAFDKHFENGTLETMDAEREGEKAGLRANKIYISKLKKKGISETYTEKVKIPIVKRKGTWRIKSKSMAVVDIATCYYNEGIEDAYNDYMDYVDDSLKYYY